MKLSHWLVALLVLTAGGIIGFQATTLNRLKKENTLLREQLAEMDRTRAAGETRRRQSDQELQRLRAEVQDLHRLRNEVSQLRATAREVDQLRRQTAELDTLRSEAQQLRSAAAQTQATPPGNAIHVPKESWVFSGYATPQDAFQSAVWAMREGNTALFLSSLAPGQRAKMEQEWRNKTPDQLSADAKRDMNKIKGYRILEQEQVGDDQMVLTIYAEGEGKAQKMGMQRLGNEWKLGGPWSK